MSEHEKAKSNDLVSGLWAFHGFVRKATNGAHGSPARIAFFRGLLVLVGLGCAGPTLGHALLAMPAGLIAVCALVVSLRVARWWWRRR